jgi:protein involved in polysaccharide export with SLBB domain
MAYPRSYSNLNGFHPDVRQLTFSRLPGISTDYRIGPGDVLAIEVVDFPNLSPKLTVSSTGLIDMPLIGAIQVTDLTASDIESEITKRLKEKQLMNKPEVLVDVTDYVAKPIYILGEVDKAGEYVMSQQWTLMDAILIAGGIDDTAGQYGFLHRHIRDNSDDDNALFLKTAPPDPRNRPVLNTLQRASRMPNVNMDRPDVAEPGTEVLRVDLTAAKKGGLVEPNLPMRKGDVLIIPRSNSESFYIVGDVKRAGPFEMRTDDSLLVTQAIAEAGGPNQTAKLSEGILVRHDSTGKRIERSVDFDAILRGKKPDFNVLPDDIIFIPGSAMRTLGLGLLGVVPGTVGQSVQLPAKK